MRLTVAVATFQREAELERLLTSIRNSRPPQPGWQDVTVVVVDNDPLRSAAQVVASLAQGFPTRLRYVTEERPGHAHARNRGISEALADGSELVQFIDDDEVVSEGCLPELTATLARCDADFVCGAVRSRFEGEPPPWVLTSRVFERRVRRTGARLDEFNDGNLLAKVAAITSRSPAPFDARLSQLGGADTLMSRDLVAAGFLAVWCEEGFAEEFVPMARCRLRYVVRRRLRIGTTDAFCTIQLQRYGVIMRLYRILRHLAVAVVRLAQAAVAVVARQRGLAYRRFFSTFFQLGRALGFGGFMIREYARPGERILIRLPRRTIDDDA
jgi:glycosyltransferase involved in cell wall biosynthesis